jgi:LIM domain kinase 1
VTEFIDSGTLQRLVMDQKQPLSWGLKMELAGDIANGMAYLHEQSVIHRDLKTGKRLAETRPNCYAS